VAPVVYPVQTEKKIPAASSKRRSSVDLNVSHNTEEVFDYDTSDSIEEEEEEVEEEPVNISVKSSRSRRSVVNDSEDENVPKKGSNRSSRRSTGGRYSTITMESSLGGVSLERRLGLILSYNFYIVLMSETFPCIACSCNVAPSDTLESESIILNLIHSSHQKALCLLKIPTKKVCVDRTSEKQNRKE
jgi:hypothetical protein